ncbi:hypothetical protein D3C83_137630 [compost metagenome]
MLWLQAPHEQLLFGVIVALFMIFTHRSNIRKMLAGEEYRFEKARFLKRLF